MVLFKRLGPLFQCVKKSTLRRGELCAALINTARDCISAYLSVSAFVGVQEL